MNGTRDLDGDHGDELLAAVHAQLRLIARRQLADERPGHTLQATALVHEAWLALRSSIGDGDPRHFHAAAADAMRRVLIDHARKRNAQKRFGKLERLPLDAVVLARSAGLDEVLAVDEAVTALATANPRAAEVVRLRFFAGLDEAAAAKSLGLSERTVRREWTFARAWLWRRLQEWRART